MRVRVLAAGLSMDFVLEAGVYRLLHRPSGRFYIGSSSNLRQRRRAWSLKLKRICGGYPPHGPNLKFYRFARETRACDWRFRIVSRVDGGRELLLAAEFDLIDRSIGDDRCLNVRPHAAGAASLLEMRR